MQPSGKLQKRQGMHACVDHKARRDGGFCIHRSKLLQPPTCLSLCAGSIAGRPGTKTAAVHKVHARNKMRFISVLELSKKTTNEKGGKKKIDL